MKSRRYLRKILVVFAILILVASIGFSACLLFFNYQNVRLFRRAAGNLRRGTPTALDTAEAQLQRLIQKDRDHEQAFLMLARIAERKKKYPEQVYYSFQAHKLNPLSPENRELYIASLLRTREFLRLENFLELERDGETSQLELLLYAAARNGNLGKYRGVLPPEDNAADSSPLRKLLRILYLEADWSAARKLQALAELRREVAPEQNFLQQEIAEARAALFLELDRIAEAEAALLEAYRINSFAFAPPLGRFYANYRSLGQALKVFERYLADYHDPLTALQAAEICCLLKERGRISSLREEYQSDSGEAALLCSYYLDALNAFAGGDLEEAKRYLVPLRQAIRTPLATYMYFCVEVEAQNLSGVLLQYGALVNLPPYLDLLIRADDRGNLPLLFFAARTLGENHRAKEALARYARFPENSAYRLVVLMNCAELGNFAEALRLARQAYRSEPARPETQYCYADKLLRSGRAAEIVNVVKPSGGVPLRGKLRDLWIRGMEEQLRRTDGEGRKEALREMCRQLLAVDPQNETGMKIHRKLTPDKPDSRSKNKP